MGENRKRDQAGIVEDFEHACAGLISTSRCLFVHFNTQEQVGGFAHDDGYKIPNSETCYSCCAWPSVIRIHDVNSTQGQQNTMHYCVRSTYRDYLPSHSSFT